VLPSDRQNLIFRLCKRFGIKLSALGPLFERSCFLAGEDSSHSALYRRITAEGVASLEWIGTVWFALGSDERVIQMMASVFSARWTMIQDAQATVVGSAYREYWSAKEALAALQASFIETIATSSITTDEGYLMYSLSGLRLLDTNYAREQVAQFHAARQNRDALRKRLMDLGEPDPE
jgi:hypothetical protein